MASQLPFDTVQSNAIQLALQGKSIYISGKPGAGKSRTSREIVRQKRLQPKDDGTMFMVEFVSYLWQTATHAGVV